MPRQYFDHYPDGIDVEDGNSRELVDCPHEYGNDEFCAVTSGGDAGMWVQSLEVRGVFFSEPSHAISLLPRIW